MLFRKLRNVYQFASKREKKGDVKQLLLILKPEYKYYVYGAIVTGLSSMVALILPSGLEEINKLHSKRKQIITEEMTEQEKQMIQQNNKKIQQDYLIFCLKWSFISLFSGFVAYKRRYINTTLSNRVAIRLRNSLYQKILQQPASYFQQKHIHSTDLVHKLSNDVSLVSQGLTMDIIAGVRGLFFVTGGAGYLLAYAQPLVPPALFMMLLLGYSTKRLGKYQQIYKILETDSLGKTSQIAQERIQAIKLIKISNTEEREKERYRAALSQYFENSKLFAKFQALNIGILEGLGYFSLFGVLTYGSFLITNGIASPSIISSSIYALYVAIGFRSLTSTYSELIKTAGIYEGLRKFSPDIHNDLVYNQSDFFTNYRTYIENEKKLQNLLLNPPINSDESNLEVNYELDRTLPPKIEFRGVTFDHDQHVILNDFSMIVAAGDIIALRGQSGSGKTTILNLLTKLNTPAKGEILIDDQPLSQKDFAWIQSHISYVPQDSVIFSGSVYENIIYGNQGFDQSLERVKWAAQMAKADEFIENMQNGYFTELKSDGGVSLSGGQKQRIILARAILKNPRILILDEATSNLDPEAEALIIQALKEICKNRTCLIVTHKIESFKELIKKEIYLVKHKHHKQKH